ncbi:toll-like receptor 4 [Mytilus trossulus]|uniref:toll-like receptor 4 n=1 Tax=Mytilus trossulus TaxID=6551 RepID=UPI0030071F3E
MKLTALLVVLGILSGISEPALVLPCDFYVQCNCTWNNHLLITNCSNLELAELPSFPSNVNVLDLSFNLFGILMDKGFKHLHHLIQLNLSNNNMFLLHQDAFYGLTKLQRLHLNDNELSYNLKTFPRLVFKALKSLTHLNVANNEGANKFPGEVISYLTNLKDLVIDARITEPNETAFGKGFLPLTHLQKLTIRYCNMHFSNDTFKNLLYLKSINLFHCTIQSYEIGTFCGRHLKFLNLNRIQEHEHYINAIMNDIKNATVDVLIMNRFFRRQFNSLGYILKTLNKTAIQKLYINGNGIIHTGTFIILPKSLLHLDLSKNDLCDLEFVMPNLIFLNLNENRLGSSLQLYRYSHSKITNLKVIYLSDNGIDRLLFSIFHGHPLLEIIDLSRNTLSDITFDLAQLQNLKMLDLSSNRISSLSPMSINGINEIFKKSDLKINLSKNVLQCSCETYQFLKWMADNSNHFMPSNDYKCRFSNGSILEIQEFKHTFLQIARECESHAVLIICVSIAIFAMLTVTIVGLVYRYRWRIRYLYYMTKSKYKQNKPVDNCYQHKYDAFISYADSEVDFVLKDCIENFEQHGNKTLCIHQRDFIPGEEIANNIINAIHESRKTICIITRSFLDSYYCMFEYNMARMESIYSRNGQNILFLVFYEQIRPKELPLIMLELVQQRSYIEYPHDEQGNVVFWAKLLEAIS